ncbi:MAG: DUF6056 family protein [Bulleidia sp.]|nr:DUF6056 family protein [Bulleidia sp.]
MENRLKKYIPYLITVIFFLAFALISRWTPPAGDDWVYAVGGMYDNPFTRTWEMYHTWSGRILSEFWGYTVAPHKNLWNILNPLLFTGIFILLQKLAEGNTKKHPIATALLAVLLVFSAANKLRMQTYTWIMGTTYVVPLFLFLLLLLLLRQWIIEDRFSKPRTLIICILEFCIPLYMENAAALVCGADLLILIYLLCNDRKKGKRMMLYMMCGIAGTCIILFSPGAHARLTGDNALFNALPLTAKVAQNWPLFLEHTYTANVLLMYCLSFVSAGYVLQKKDNFRNKAWIIYLVIFLAAPFLNSGYFYLLETGMLFLLFIFHEEDKEKKMILIFLLLCALGADLVMLVSPIFDSRSSLYTVYILFLLTLTIFEELGLPKVSGYAVTAVFAVLCIARGLNYYHLYHTVHLITIRRNAEIQYYQVNPEAGDAWIVAYPDDMIHSPNVLEGDSTHDYYFKEYYYLNQDLHLVFYYLDDYTDGNILKS